MIGDFVSRLRKGLEKSTSRIAEMLDLAVGHGVFDEAAAEELEEALILADVGPETSAELVDELKTWVRDAGGGVAPETIREALAISITRKLAVASKPRSSASPEIILIVGINGTGKTTTAAKIAAKSAASGKRVILGAADTFRAAAADQLKVWAERLDIPVITGAEGADPAAVAYDAVQAAISRAVDVAIIDTAGRLHTKVNLMNELEKIVRVVRKLREPSEILLVIDGTTGQNGILQVETFVKTLPVTGLVITKLDGSAKAGSVVAAVRKFGVPVRYIGVGETPDDLLDFDPDAFARELVGSTPTLP